MKGTMCCLMSCSGLRGQILSLSFALLSLNTQSWLRCFSLCPSATPCPFI